MTDEQIADDGAEAEAATYEGFQEDVSQALAAYLQATEPDARSKPGFAEFLVA